MACGVRALRRIGFMKLVLAVRGGATWNALVGESLVARVRGRRPRASSCLSSAPASARP